MISGKFYSAKCILGFVDRPTVLGSYLYGMPGEEHLLYTDDAGETWFIPGGMKMSKEWILRYRDVQEVDTRGLFVRLRDRVFGRK